jgi:hypothetical protein
MLLLIRPRAYSKRISLKRCTSSSSRPASPFQYVPLDAKKNEIRLLTVLQLDQSGTLLCSLKHQPLNHRLEYHGLSYAWKDIDIDKNDDGEEILVNNYRMIVGRNVAAALKARQSHEFCNVPLWVDAICINQDDTTERNAQILRMRNIYAQASLVTVWLGPERDKSAQALDFIRTICQASKDFEGWVKAPHGEIWVKDSSTFSKYLRDHLISREHSQDWQALHKLLQRVWWKRMWIIQETISAKRIVFFCGPQTLDPQDLSQFLDILAAHAVIYLPLLYQTEGIILDYGTFSLARAYLRPTTWGTISLLQALYRTGMALSMDPRDKVFAILNLAHDGAKMVPNPDYSLSVAEIYKQLVVSIVKDTGRLDILSLGNLPVYPQRLEMQIPTWVPDWTQRVTSTVNSRIAAVTPVWADKGSRAVSTFSNDNNTLTAKGFIVDIIDGLAMCLTEVEPSTSNPQLHQSQSREGMYAGLGVIDAIWRSLLANRNPVPHHHAPPGIRKPYRLELFLQQCRRLSRENISLTPTSSSEALTFRTWYHNNQGLIVAGRTIKEWVNDPSLPELDSASFADDFDFFDFELTSHFRSWRFFTTMNGYAGLGPNTCQPGDKVVIILGCASPLVLRAVESHYELVGECYVHGIMHGEAMRGPRKRSYEMVDSGYDRVRTPYVNEFLRGERALRPSKRTYEMVDFEIR